MSHKGSFRGLGPGCAAIGAFLEARHLVSSILSYFEGSDSLIDVIKKLYLMDETTLTGICGIHTSSGIYYWVHRASYSLVKGSV